MIDFALDKKKQIVYLKKTFHNEYLIFGAMKRACQILTPKEMIKKQLCALAVKI